MRTMRLKANNGISINEDVANFDGCIINMADEDLGRVPVESENEIKNFVTVQMFWNTFRLQGTQIYGRNEASC